MLDLGIVSRFCKMIRRMCEKGNVRKSSTINTDFLADSINVDVLIKKNHINFIGKKSVERGWAFQYFKVLSSISFCCWKNYDERCCLILWTCLFIKFCWCCFSWVPFVSTKHMLSGYLFCECCKPKWGCRNIPRRLLGQCLPVWEQSWWELSEDFTE